MKNVIILISVLATTSAWSQVNLTPGGSVTLAGIQVNCMGAAPSSGASAYLNLPNSKIMEILKTTGIGPCKIRQIENLDFFYSPRFRNGVHLSSTMHAAGAIGFIRAEIKSGDCD